MPSSADMLELRDMPHFTYSPLGAMKDAEEFLATVGIVGDPKLAITPDGGLQQLAVDYNDSKEGKEHRGLLITITRLVR